MSWYEEKISIKRGTIYNVWGTVLFIVSLGMVSAVAVGLMFEDLAFNPLWLMFLVILIQQFLLSVGLLLAMQDN